MTKKKAILNEIREIISHGSCFCVLSHIRPDGDAVGSVSALHLALKNLQKESYPVLKDGIPKQYQFIEASSQILTEIPENKMFDAVFILDVASFKRTGFLDISLGDITKKLVIIDHHQLPDTLPDADTIFIDPSYAAVGEILFELLEPMNCIDTEIARSLYVSIVTDTGGFKFSNTNERTHAIISKLFSYNINSADIMQKIYSENELSKIALLGKCLSFLKIRDNVGYSVITDELLEEAHATTEDSDGIINHIMSIRGLKAAALFHDTHGKRKVSLRAQGLVDVSKIAKQFGGGGHKNAAGFASEMNLDELIETVFEKLS